MKDKHVTPPAIFILQEKMREQQKEIDERDARIAELEKENRYLRMSLNRLYGEVSNGEHLDKDWIKETLKSVPYDRFTEALQGRIKNLQSKLELAVEGLRFYADEAKWESQQYPNYGRRLATIHDKDVGEVIAKTGHRWSIGGKTAREVLNQIGETECP